MKLEDLPLPPNHPVELQRRLIQSIKSGQGPEEAAAVLQVIKDGVEKMINHYQSTENKFTFADPKAMLKVLNAALKSVEAVEQQIAKNNYKGVITAAEKSLQQLVKVVELSRASTRVPEKKPSLLMKRAAQNFFRTKIEKSNLIQITDPIKPEMNIAPGVDVGVITKLDTHEALAAFADSYVNDKEHMEQYGAWEDEWGVYVIADTPADAFKKYTKFVNDVIGEDPFHDLSILDFNVGFKTSTADMKKRLMQVRNESHKTNKH